MNNPDRALATLTGEMHALFMAVQAFAITHPFPAEALRVFDELTQHGLAALEPHLISDAVIVGFQDTAQGIRQALEANQR